MVVELGVAGYISHELPVVGFEQSGGHVHVAVTPCNVPVGEVAVGVATYGAHVLPNPFLYSATSVLVRSPRLPGSI